MFYITFFLTTQLKLKCHGKWWVSTRITFFRKAFSWLTTYKSWDDHPSSLGFDQGLYPRPGSTATQAETCIHLKLNESRTWKVTAIQIFSELLNFGGVNLELWFFVKSFRKILICSIIWGWFFLFVLFLFALIFFRNISKWLAVNTEQMKQRQVFPSWMRVCESLQFRPQVPLYLPLKERTVEGSEIRLTSWYGEYPIIQKGFYTSQVVVWDFFHQ